MKHADGSHDMSGMLDILERGGSVQQLLELHEIVVAHCRSWLSYQVADSEYYAAARELSDGSPEDVTIELIERLRDFKRDAQKHKDVWTSTGKKLDAYTAKHGGDV